MEVKIGIQLAPRELVVETAASAQEIEQALSSALADGKIFALADKKGRTVLVPAEKVAYVELDAAGPRPVGFASH
ncbi:MAG TPA: DUF3107 domain-containing protein [Streptosporangiaceae bacterium]|nr:DUF3107 domain-containing protein [Streptosporangiaceae bacterium]